MRTFFGLWILLAGLCAPSIGQAGGNQKISLPGDLGSIGEEKQRFVEALDRLEKDCETQVELRSRLLTLGAMSEAEVDQVRLVLARVRINKARTANKPHAVHDELQNILKIRERELSRLQAMQRMSSVSSYEVRSGQRRLSYTRFSLAVFEGRSKAAIEELRETVKYCEAELKSLSELGGAIAGSELDSMRYIVAIARYSLAREEGRTEDAVRELRTAVEMAEAVQERLARLQGGSKLALEEEMVRLKVRITRLRLAMFEKKPEGVREHIRQSLELYEEIQKRLRADPGAVTRLLQSAYDHDLAMYRYHLALVASGGELLDYELWGLLDY